LTTSRHRLLILSDYTNVHAGTKMDIHEILYQKIKELPTGPHVDGLRAVKSHIDAATRHLLRGQKEPDESLFTDVIFRCNQAFEGSIKEAYRVLAGKDPQKITPHEIEKFLDSSNTLKRKVLDQFTIYRKEWRNPSTHDYTLDFDEDEALVAIVSVTVFAIVLCDQIDSKLAFDIAAAAPAGPISSAEQNGPLLELVANKALSFAQSHVDIIGQTRSPAHDYYRLEGELAGYLTAELSSIKNISVIQNSRFSSNEADVVIERESEKVIIELKRTSIKLSVKGVVQRAVTQAALYLHEPDVVGAVALIYSANSTDYSVSPATGALAGLVRIIAPQSDKGPVA
jgi:hypothetical protein